jgi:TetR/AcrR family transcriptional regulator of autoinduction and epiphytic fitness
MFLTADKLTNQMTVEQKNRSQLKREAIVEAAMYAFKEFGVQATSMDKLAEIAHVSKRTVYNHFATKEILVMHLVSDLWQKSLAQIDISYNANETLDGQLFQLIMAEVELVTQQDYIDLSRVAMGYLFYSPEVLQKEIEKITCQETAMQRWLKAAVADKKLIIKDIDFAYTQLHNLVKGSCFWPLLFKIQPPLTATEKQHIVTETIEMFLLRYQPMYKST